MLINAYFMTTKLKHYMFFSRAVVYKVKESILIKRRKKNELTKE